MAVWRRDFIGIACSLRSHIKHRLMYGFPLVLVVPPRRYPGRGCCSGQRLWAVPASSGGEVCIGNVGQEPEESSVCH